MTVLCLVIGGAIIIGERCMTAHDRWAATFCDHDWCVTGYGGAGWHSTECATCGERGIA